jgi:hypothetical protein
VRADLVSAAASQATDGGLDCAASRVDVGLESRGVLVRHDCCCLFASGVIVEVEIVLELFEVLEKLML